MASSQRVAGRKAPEKAGEMRGWPGFAGIVCDSITFASILEFRLPSGCPLDSLNPVINAAR
jgi:hypothetical protein